MLQKIKAQLIELTDNQNVSMLSISRDAEISYQSLRRLILDQNSNPTMKTLRKLEVYLNKVNMV